MDVLGLGGSSKRGHQTRVVSSKMAIFASFSYYTFKHSHTRPKLLNRITVQISHWLSTDTEIDVVIKSNQTLLRNVTNAHETLRVQ